MIQTLQTQRIEATAFLTTVVKDLGIPEEVVFWSGKAKGHFKALAWITEDSVNQQKMARWEKLGFVVDEMFVTNGQIAIHLIQKDEDSETNKNIREAIRYSTATVFKQNYAIEGHIEAIQ